MERMKGGRKKTQDEHRHQQCRWPQHNRLDGLPSGLSENTNNVCSSVSDPLMGKGGSITYLNTGQWDTETAMDRVGGVGWSGKGSPKT